MVPPPAALAKARQAFHNSLIERGVISVGIGGVASIADSGSEFSRRLSMLLIERIGNHQEITKLKGQRSGSLFETTVKEFMQATFPLLDSIRPGNWRIESGRISNFYQFAHLADLARINLQHPELSAIIGSDYIIKPDITIAREPESDKVINRRTRVVDASTALRAPIRREVNSLPILHAVISCKLTMRSDRAQNSRTEALSLIRHRKGNVPHIAVVTAEPLPSRIASLALGTGDIDCVYHAALPELIAAVSACSAPDAADLIQMMIDGLRLKDISDLPLDLAV